MKPPQCQWCHAPLERLTDPEPFASEFPGVVQEWGCTANPEHGGMLIDYGRLDDTQRLHLRRLLKSFAGSPHIKIGFWQHTPQDGGN